MAVWTNIADFGIPPRTDMMCLWASDDEFLLACDLDDVNTDCFTNPRSALYGATRWMSVEDALKLQTVNRELAERAATIAAIDDGDED